MLPTGRGTCTWGRKGVQSDGYVVDGCGQNGAIADARDAAPAAMRATTNRERERDRREHIDE